MKGRDALSGECSSGIFVLKKIGARIDEGKVVKLAQG